MAAFSVRSTLRLAASAVLATAVQIYMVHVVSADPASSVRGQNTKFVSEPETRAGMDRIRQRVIDVHTLITHRRMAVANAKRFAKDVDGDLALIAEHRTSAGAGADPISPILQQIKRGAAAIADPTPERGQIEGLVDVVAALESYGTAFDHPNWRKLQEQ